MFLDFKDLRVSSELNKIKGQYFSLISINRTNRFSTPSQYADNDHLNSNLKNITRKIVQ